METIMRNNFDLVSLQVVRDRSINVTLKKTKDYDYNAYQILKETYGAPDKEFFGFIGLDNHLEVTCIHTVAVGGVNSVNASAKDVFKAALASNSSKVILFHNHPTTNNIRVSAGDKSVTKRMIIAGEILGIKVIDHIIFNDVTYASLKRNGLMAKFEKELLSR